jgi:hypothetical protein
MVEPRDAAKREGLCCREVRWVANKSMRFNNTIISVLLTCAVLMLAGCDRGTADYTRGISDRCEVHGIKTTKTRVPIEYGLVRLNEWGKQKQIASTYSFPHAQESLLAGCVVENATGAVIYACSACQEARRKWELEHPKSSPL